MYDAYKTKTGQEAQFIPRHQPPLQRKGPGLGSAKKLAAKMSQGLKSRDQSPKEETGGYKKALRKLMVNTKFQKSVYQFGTKKNKNKVPQTIIKELNELQHRTELGRQVNEQVKQAIQDKQSRAHIEKLLL